MNANIEVRFRFFNEDFLYLFQSLLQVQVVSSCYRGSKCTCHCFVERPAFNSQRYSELLLKHTVQGQIYKKALGSTYSK